jgi:cytochrome c2
MTERKPRSLRKLELSAYLLSCVALSACSSSSEESAVERGRKLFESKALSTSSLNDYSCATCHDVSVGSTASKKTGAQLAGVTLRTEFWGGQEADLLRSINACRNYFMVASEPLTDTDADARSLYAYLESLEPGDETAQPFSVVANIDLLPRGDFNRGLVVYAESCASCHGAMHTGTDRLSIRVPILPEDTLASHVNYSLRSQRLVFTEKVRHGLFHGYGGVMPPFSSQLMSDEDVSDLLEALQVLGDPNQIAE